MNYSYFCGHLFSVILNLSLSQSCIAQSAFEKNLRQNYPTAKISISENTSGQAQGLFHIYGDSLQIQPGKVADASVLTGKIKENPRQAVALQFLETKKNLLNVESIATDLKLKKTSSDSFGGTHLRYQRYLQGVRLDAMEVLVHINDKNEVTGINGYITPVSSQLKQAVSLHLVNGSPNIGAAEVIAAIATDLKIAEGNLNILSAAPLVITESPYVVWQVDAVLRNSLGRYIYRIADSPGAEILFKKLIIQS